jgi:pimeloyl-ACP methyl ester carboxylesterase
VVAGVSIGAHAAAQWAAATGVQEIDLLLVMPAWTGDPGSIASATAAAAERLEVNGTSAELARIRSENPDDWVVAELTRAWPQWSEPALIAALRSAARSVAPTVEELAQIRTRTGIVGLRGDPLHPASTAGRWHDAIPRSALTTIDRTAPAGDVALLGRAAAAAARSAQTQGSR